MGKERRGLTPPLTASRSVPSANLVRTMNGVQNVWEEFVRMVYAPAIHTSRTTKQVVLQVKSVWAPKRTRTIDHLNARQGRLWVLHATVLLIVRQACVFKGHVNARKDEDVLPTTIA